MNEWILKCVFSISQVLEIQWQIWQIRFQFFPLLELWIYGPYLTGRELVCSSFVCPFIIQFSLKVYFLLFFMAPQRLSAASEWSWTSLSQPLAARAHWSGWWTKTSYLLQEAYGHRSCCWHSGWRIEGLCGPSQWWNAKQSFPMKHGVLTHGRVCLLLSKGHSSYRPRRAGESKCKSVRGGIVDANLSVLNLVIVKKGEKDIPGLTDTPL